jgi:ankyrin repeat protein
MTKMSNLGARVLVLPGVYKYLPIHAAAMYGNLPIFKALCAAGANIRSRDGTGQTTFHYACHGENLEVMKYLLAELGVNVIRVYAHSNLVCRSPH